MTFEVEQKFHVDDVVDLENRLRDLGAVETETQQHVDTYFNHPCRDFAETREAFRVRRINGVPMVTYKGTKLPGAIKARQELEWRLDPGDPNGNNMEQLLGHLSFRRVASVQKTRRLFTMPPSLGDIAVMIDRVESLGAFAEIEVIVDESTEVETARQRIASLALQLSLDRSESESYLSMLLSLDARQ